MRAGVTEFDARCVFMLAGPMLPVIGTLARRTEEVAAQAGTANRLGGENAIAIAGVLRLMYRQALGLRLDDVRNRMTRACAAQMDEAVPSTPGSSFDPTVLWSPEERERFLGIPASTPRGVQPTGSNTCGSYRREVAMLERELERYGSTSVAVDLDRLSPLLDRVLTSCAGSAENGSVCVEAQRELAAVLRPQSQTATPAAPVAVVSP